MRLWSPRVPAAPPPPLRPPAPPSALRPPLRAEVHPAHAPRTCGPRRMVAHASASSETEPAQPSTYDKVVETLTTMFPVWVMLGAGIGIVNPGAVTWFSSDLFTLGLGFLMLSMGLTLTFEDFRQCAMQPVPILVGYLAQYIIKPLAGYLIATAMGLPPALATGLILVSCCPGGQASNVATYIAHGNVALSVLMTTASTLGAIIMTPLLTKLLAGAIVSVDAWGLAVSTFQVVLVPTVAGVLLNEYANGLVSKIKPILPLIGVVMTTLLCASPVGQVADVLRCDAGARWHPAATAACPISSPVSSRAPSGGAGPTASP